MKQLHKKFTDNQIKELITRYLQKKIARKYIQKQRDGSLFYTLKILLTVNPVNLDTCLSEQPSSPFRYFKTLS